MHFNATKDANEELLWSLILTNLGSSISKDVSPATPDSFRAADALNVLSEELMES